MAKQALEHLASQPPKPTHRLLRGYAFDPSLSGQLATADISKILYKVPWEELPDGPRGQYVEVVDFDPPSGCFYAPVQLDHPAILAQNGLPPSEGNPQFHQQMVYAVAMTTIDRFERALGRKAMWAGRWADVKGKGKGETREREHQFVQHLRIYPHALREANAYYSRDRRALLFGYFPANARSDSTEMPGGLVFTCLAHDIVAHETTHALLDGFHEHFMEATNADVLAFHEAFADIVALFQHFSFPEQLKHQIARTRGELSNENLLAQLATQFGHASGSRGALRDFIGRENDKGEWTRLQPKPEDLAQTTEVHARGAILVAAVFDAFLGIYQRRIKDLMQLTEDDRGPSGSGELPPALVERLAKEAAKAAGHMLNICIRALDYCPPVDLTFGEYLRALITADMDLMAEDAYGYRVAIIEAFRRRGIYPDHVRTLSEDSLRWARPEEDPSLAPGQMKQMVKNFITHVDLRGHVESLRYLQTRREIWDKTRGIRKALHAQIRQAVVKQELLQRLTGLKFSPDDAGPQVRLSADGRPSFQVHAFREARRLREDGRILNQVFITLLQTERVEIDGKTRSVRCGSTLVIDLDELTITYAIRKGFQDRSRQARTTEFQERGGAALAMRNTYLGAATEIFAALHQH